MQEVVGDELSSFEMHAHGWVVARPLAYEKVSHVRRGGKHMRERESYVEQNEKGR